MSVAIVTGATGLVGAAAVERLHAEDFDVVGLDNDMRRRFFPEVSSNDRIVNRLTALARYTHRAHDIRDETAIGRVFAAYGRDIRLIVHAAAQPSHDWAVDDPLTDFSVNATGTLLLLEATRKHCPEAAFVFCSTNKVYGSRPNELPFIEHEMRWEIDAEHRYFHRGITEDFGIDATTHSLFGVSKAAADLMVQEYGRYFGMKTAVFRAGCVTGAGHRGATQHGFLAYLARQIATGGRYDVIGHKGKQVRDNIHADDLVDAFIAFFRRPGSGEIYNIGGGRERSCSVIEAIELFEKGFARKLERRYIPQARLGDHVWWITDCGKFKRAHPNWMPRHSLADIVDELVQTHADR